MTLRRISLLLAAIALAIFARLAQRHVGDSYFLADQVDQLQKYEAALRFEPEGLLGPGMSGTDARALGPFGAVMLGLPLSLGFGVNAIHGFTSLLLAIGVTVAFFQLLRLNASFAWTWLLVFIAMRITWWNAGMFWVNTLLLPLGLLILAAAVHLVRRRSPAAACAVVVLALLALQVHLAAVVILPVLAVVMGVGHFTTPPAERWSRTALATIPIALLVLLPYGVAEARTGFRNTKAMFQHVDASVHGDREAGRHAATESLSRSLDPLEVFPSAPVAIAAGAGVALLALAITWTRRTDMGDIAWLVTAAITGVAGQAVFFLLMARPLNGLHYVSLLAPWYPIPLAAIVAAATSHRVVQAVAAPVLGVAAVALLLLRGPALADRYAEPTAWTYGRIVTALNGLCGGRTARTIEGPGLVDGMNPSYDSVLRYLMKRGFTTCRYDAGSDLLIVDNRGEPFADVREIGDERFEREFVAEPGLAVYRRAR